jgi:chemotaxis protein CheX
MDEPILNILAASVIRYFNITTEIPAILGTPFLGHPEETLSLDFSAVIGISGSYKGNIYYTAPRAKLHSLLTMLGEGDVGDDLCAELVGEITNTISGNAREELGSGFMISTPLLLTGNNNAVKPANKAPCFILPIEWNTFSSRLLITLSESSAANSK